MRTYQPGAVPSDPAELPGFLRQEFPAIQQAAHREDGYLAVLPERPQDRIYLFAAGVAGTSRGAYRYDPSTTAYTMVAADVQAFPIGAVFISVVATNPATLLGYGTWSAFGAGRVLVGLDAGDADFDTAEKTGGAKTVTSTGTVSQPTFTGKPVAAASTAATPDLVTANVTSTGVSPVTTATGTVSQPTYTGNATSVVQPYIVVYMWKRTA